MKMYLLDTGEGEGSEETNLTRRITLDGQSYSFNYRYNLRDASWIVSIGLVSEEPMFTVKACCNRVFNDQYFHLDNAPQGALMIVDSTGKYGRVDFEGLSSNGRYKLIYINGDT